MYGWKSLWRPDEVWEVELLSSLRGDGSGLDTTLMSTSTSSEEDILGAGVEIVLKVWNV